MHYRTIFISDIHLGTRGCAAERLLEFLKNNSCDHLYLVGDIIDFWSLSRKSYFPKSHLAVIRKIVEMSVSGTRVTYVTGNHDECLRPFAPLRIGNIQVVNERIHATADGRRLLVIHGDEFDPITTYAPWLANLGDILYQWLMRCNWLVNWVLKRIGCEPWSLSAFMKARVKRAVNFIGDYESSLATVAAERDLDGVVCGHIHHAEITEMHGIVYYNDGDWVESCTALVEEADGSLKLVS